MRKNWSESEDSLLRRVVDDVGVEDWTAVAREFRQNCTQITRTGKQCRQRWYNHLNPIVNKQSWSYQEQRLLFDSQRSLGNKWKEISLQFEGRTDNNIKNHFYSTLRRSLRRLNKIAGQKNATLRLREIKPTVLTTILNAVYEEDCLLGHQGELMAELRDLPKLIFEFAAFKPVKGNMASTLKENHEKIETIFRLVEQFKSTYSNQNECRGRESEEKQTTYARNDEFLQQFTIGEFRPLEKKVNILIRASFEPFSPSTKWEVCEKEMETMKFESFSQENLMEIYEPTSITNIAEPNPFTELIVVGRQWTPNKGVEIHTLGVNLTEI